MVIGDDPIEIAKQRGKKNFTLPAITDFSLPFWERKQNNQVLPQFNQQNYKAAYYQQNVPLGGFGFGVGYNRRSPLDIFNQDQQTQTPTRSSSPFINGGYQFPAGSQLPSGYKEIGGGGLTQGTPTAPRVSQSAFVNGGYTFPAGSALPEGFQENGGGGLTRQVSGTDPTGAIASALAQNKGKLPNWSPEEWQQATGGQYSSVPPGYGTHFLPPGFTATTGSTGVQGSSPNDIHFLPPGFTAVNQGQLQFQPPKKQDFNLGGSY